MNNRIDKTSFSRVFLYIVLSLYAALCFIPFILIVGGSFTKEQEIIAEGYKIIPKKFSLEAYELLFKDPSVILNGYKVTIIVTILGTLAGILMTTLIAYPLSRSTFRFRRTLSVYTIIPLLFNGGMVTWYITCVKYLHLKNTMFALILPALLNVFNIFLVRNYFQSIPLEIHDSASIDGAGEFGTYRHIIMPLSVPVLATVSLFIALFFWNDWYLGVMLNDKAELQPLQLILRAIHSDMMFLKESQRMLGTEAIMPQEGVKLATCLVTIGPIVLLYPMVQKYFVKGILLGSVKG